MLHLFDYHRSSAAFRVRLALNYKCLSYAKIPVNLLAGEQSQSNYLNLNPAGLVPTLQTGQNFLQQSLAIIEYLEEYCPQPALLPQSPIERAYVRAIALSIACDIHPLNNLRVLNYLRTNLQQTEDEVGSWYRHWISVGLTSLEQQISTSQFYSGEFVFGTQFTLADLCLLPQLVSARRFQGTLDSYPTLLKIEAHCRQYEWVNLAYPTN